MPGPLSIRVMYRSHRILVLIPALDEAPSLPYVLGAIPDWVDQVVVVDNGSTDDTATIARQWGATVVAEPRRGYGRACQAGLNFADSSDVVVFLDGDYSDDPAEMGALIAPICNAAADLVIGSRTTGRKEPGAMPRHQRLGNAFTTRFIALATGVRFTDLGPFRGIRTACLRRLSMRDEDYGWTVEMQLKAIFHGLKIREVPMSYRKRLGRSKISGSLITSVVAGLRMNWRVCKEVYAHRTARR